MRRYLANIWLLLAIGFIAVGTSTIISIMSCKWHWFGRSGAILTMVGVLLSVRPLVRLKFSEWVRFKSTIEGGTWDEPTLEQQEADRQAELDSKATLIGTILAFVGTLIWAYGELIGGLP